VHSRRGLERQLELEGKLVPPGFSPARSELSHVRAQQEDILLLMCVVVMRAAVFT
jgi:hypothetical protein